MAVCDYRMKRGWWCSRPVRGHRGPCALRPRWWNWGKDARRYRGVSF